MQGYRGMSYLLGCLLCLLLISGGASTRVRLVNGTATQGRVEVFDDNQGQWATICDNSWYREDGNVICRQLGFPSAKRRAYFGQGSGPILTNIVCRGNESNIDECPKAASDMWESRCDHSNDAGVVCDAFTSTPAPIKVRLVGGKTYHGYYGGIVEVYYKGEWGTVCSYPWDIKAANVICRQLGYPSASQTPAYAYRYFGQGSGPLLLYEVDCLGIESSIDDCLKTDVWDGCYVPDNYLRDDAGVVCNELLTTPVPSAGISAVAIIGINVGSSLVFVLILVSLVFVYSKCRMPRGPVDSGYVQCKACLAMKTTSNLG